MVLTWLIMYASTPQTPFIIMTWLEDALKLKNIADTLSNLFGLIRARKYSFHVFIFGWLTFVLRFLI